MRGIMRDRRDDGVYAILYALFVIVFFAVCALVVDLGVMREGRASTRSAADSASVAAASHLNAVDPAASDPRAACQAAWLYLRQGLPGLPDGSSSCVTAGYPTTAGLAASPCTSATSPLVAAYAGSEWTVRITWPVPDTSTLMSQPDQAPARRTQSLNPTVDGTEPCGRIAVEVFQKQPLRFASAFGGGSASTRAASVARSIVTGGTSQVLASLNILEQSECSALTTSGQGSIDVNGAGTRKGIIAVESSGTASGNSCNGAQTAVISPSSNGNNFIHANGPGGTGTGLIQDFAMNASPRGNPAKAYVNAANLSPTPTVLPDRYGARPVTDVFNCTATCTDGGGPYISDLRTLYGGAGAPAGFTTLPNATYPNFVCSGGASTPTAVIPPGKWYVDCATLSVSTTVIFQGGTVVTRGGVELGSSSACFVINVTASSCPSVVAAVGNTPATTAPPPTGDAVLFMRSGRLYKTSQAQLYLPQTFTYLGNGWTDLGGGSGTLFWTTPAATSCGSDVVCQYRAFHKLVLWSEGTSLHSLGGQSTLVLRGVLFTPNAASVFDGQGGSQQTNAQFWTRTLEVKGQGTLVMTADPDASVSRPSSGAALIR